MNERIKQAKQAIRPFIATFSDPRLADVYAANADGKMSFYDPCGCLRGVAYEGLAVHTRADRCDLCHYDMVDDDVAIAAEWGYNKLAFGEHLLDAADAIRQRRLSPILRAEIRRRDRLAQSRAIAHGLVEEMCCA